MRFRARTFVAVFALLPGCASWFTSTSSAFSASEPVYLRERLASESSEPNNKRDHYAVLIGGDTELEHRASISLAYQVLVEQGYAREQIYILDSEGENPFFPLTDVTTREALQLLFAHLKAIVGPEDTLFIYVTGKGKTDPETAALEPSVLELNPGEELTQEEFAAMVDKIHPESGVLFFDQCYWAAMASERLCNFVVINSSENQNAKHGASFPRAFWAAFRERRTAAAPLTIFDAFRFAMVADRPTTLGLNKPRLAHACVNPASITLLGLRPDLADAPSK